MNPSSQPDQGFDRIVLGVTLIFIIVLLIVIAVLMQFVGLYIRARVSGAPVTLVELIGMRLRNINVRTVINARIQAVHAGLDISIPDMESHLLAGGNLQRVISAMIAAPSADVDLPWKTATAIDLAGRDVLEEVRKQIPPSVPLHHRPRSP